MLITNLLIFSKLTYINNLLITLLKTNRPQTAKKWEKMVKIGKKCIILLGKNQKVMSNPTGTFNCKLDAKGRLMLPADFREQLGDQTEGDFILRPGLHGTYLELYTIGDWNRRREILMQVNTFDRRKLDIMRKYLDGVRRVKLDANGRLQIPKDLLERSGMSKDVVIDSMFTNMEIWDKAKYDERVNAISSDELASGVEELFSGLQFGI